MVGCELLLPFCAGGLDLRYDFLRATTLFFERVALLWRWLICRLMDAIVKWIFSWSNSECIVWFVHCVVLLLHCNVFVFICILSLWCIICIFLFCMKLWGNNPMNPDAAVAYRPCIPDHVFSAWSGCKNKLNWTHFDQPLSFVDYPWRQTPSPRIPMCHVAANVSLPYVAAVIFTWVDWLLSVSGFKSLQLNSPHWLW